MNVDVPLADSRRIKVLANGLPLWQGAQAAVSPVGRYGAARAGADRVPGKAAADAARRKRQATYPELLAARRYRLVVLAVEVGGRFGAEMADFLRRVAASKARTAPPWHRAAARQAAGHRWTGMLAVAAQRALALSLLELPLDRADECDGVEPPLADLLADARHVYPHGREPQVARLDYAGRPSEFATLSQDALNPWYPHTSKPFKVVAESNFRAMVWNRIALSVSLVSLLLVVPAAGQCDEGPWQSLQP